jgi:hypothetical protein
MSTRPKTYWIKVIPEDDLDDEGTWIDTQREDAGPPMSFPAAVEELDEFVPEGHFIASYELTTGDPEREL